MKFGSVLRQSNLLQILHLGLEHFQLMVRPGHLIDLLLQADNLVLQTLVEIFNVFDGSGFNSELPVESSSQESSNCCLTNDDLPLHSLIVSSRQPTSNVLLDNNGLEYQRAILIISHTLTKSTNFWMCSLCPRP